MPVEALRKRWDARAAAAAVHATMAFVGDELVLGAGTRLGGVARGAGLADEPDPVDDVRLAAKLSAAYRRPIGAPTLRYIRRALAKQGEGETAAALTHLALTGLPRLLQPEQDARRLFMADGLMEAGVAPRTIVEALDLDPAPLDELARRYDPDQPRVPAGSGRESGQWTNGDGVAESNAKRPSSHGVQVADNSPNWGQYASQASESAADLVPGAYYGRLAAGALHGGNYSDAAIYEAAALLDAAIGMLSAGAATKGEAALRAAAQMVANKLAGRAAEKIATSKLVQGGVKVGGQVTLLTDSGVRTRVDIMARDPATDAIRCIECKASETAPLTPNQAAAFPEIESRGATIVGAGKPGFPGGTRLPPTRVEIIRNPKE